MGRSKAKSHLQPDDRSCGPASLKTALEILGVRKSLGDLIKLCKTNRNGTSPAKLIRAANHLGISVMAVEETTLTHLQNTLKYKSLKPRAVIVDYLYDLKADFSPHEESGHYAAVASYSASNRRIILFDSSTGTKKSYDWKDFMNRWCDFEFKKHGNKLIRSWNNRLMFVLARDPKHLPKFKISTAKLFLP